MHPKRHYLFTSGLIALILNAILESHGILLTLSVDCVGLIEILYFSFYLNFLKAIFTLDHFETSDDCIYDILKIAFIIIIIYNIYY